MERKQQQPGTLDPSFGDEGKVIYSYGPGGGGRLDGYARVKPDGRILAIRPVGDSVSLVRFLPDGSIDQGFGEQGIVNTVLRQGMKVLSMEWQFQGTGNVIVATQVATDWGSEMNEVIVVRLLQDGTLDTTFGESGIAALPLERALLVVTGLSIGDTSIAVTVSQRRGFDVYFSLICLFNPGGQLSESFGGGIVYGPSDDYHYSAILAQSDGKIIVAGKLYSTNALLTARYSLDGSLDAQYGNNGFFEFALSEEGYTQVQGIALQPDGKAVVAGDAGASDGGLLLRVTAGGTVDDSFNGGEPVFVSVGDTGSENRMVAVQADGCIVALAFAVDSSDTALIRLLPTGAIDVSFGEAGVARVDFGGIDMGNMVTIQSDGKLLISAITLVTDGISWLSMARLIG